MNKTAYYLLTVIVVFGAVLLMNTKSRAGGKSFSGVVPFATNAGRFGFFDRNDGKIYFYDSDLSQCIFVGQLEDLGKPIKAVDVHARP